LQLVLAIIAVFLQSELLVCNQQLQSSPELQHFYTAIVWK
jgi:hypothetical protein